MELSLFEHRLCLSTCVVKLYKVMLFSLRIYRHELAKVFMVTFVFEICWQILVSFSFSPQRLTWYWKMESVSLDTHLELRSQWPEKLCLILDLSGKWYSVFFYLRSSQHNQLIVWDIMISVTNCHWLYYYDIYLKNI